MKVLIALIEILQFSNKEIATFLVYPYFKFAVSTDRS